MRSWAKPPDYVVKDVPPTGSLPVTQPAIYFGEITNTYAVAPSAPRSSTTRRAARRVHDLHGTHGVQMSEVNKALWALKLGDFNLLVSSQVNNQSQMLYRRNILQRASEPHRSSPSTATHTSSWVDGKAYWILDAYTTGSTYPYSQTVTFQGASDINYIRNSVKVVVDAYEGTVDFYVIDPKDPLIQGLPGNLPLPVQADRVAAGGPARHLRVPADLFNAQVQIYATYHISDPRLFFTREDVWDIPTAQTSPGSVASPVQPYYVLFRLPGETNPEFLLSCRSPRVAKQLWSPGWRRSDRSALRRVRVLCAPQGQGRFRTAAGGQPDHENRRSRAISPSSTGWFAGRRATCWWFQSATRSSIRSRSTCVPPGLQAC